MCGVKEKRSGKNSANIPGNSRAGLFIVTAWEWGWQGSQRWGVQHSLVLQTNQGTHGQNAWEGERTDSRWERGDQRQRSLFGSHRMQWKSTNATCYTIKTDKAETERKCFAICTGCMHWSVLWCLTNAITILSGLLQLSIKWHSHSSSIAPIKPKSSVTHKAQQTMQEVRVTLLHVQNQLCSMYHH